ncbi:MULTISPECIES: DUF4870 family protein [unclassified Vreelandella]
MQDDNTPLNGDVVGSEAQTGSVAKKPDTTFVMVNYALYLAGYVTGGFTMLVGLIIAYVYRGKGPEWLDEHYRYQIRTFWIGMVYSVISLFLFLFVIGILMLVLLAVWMIVRIVVGFKALQEGRAPSNVDTWLI